MKFNYNHTQTNIAAVSAAQLHSALLSHSSLVLTMLDFCYFTVLYLTAENPTLSLFFALLFPVINLPSLKLSNSTSKPYIKYSLTLTLIPMFFVCYYAGASGPGWLLCFSGAAASQLMVDSTKYRIFLMASFVLTACCGSYMAGKGIVEVSIIFITLLAFTVIFNRVMVFMLLQNRELNRLRKEAELASEAKSRFLSNMNHELRTPMNGVLGTVQLLENSQVAEEQKQYIEILKSSGEHLLCLINDILDVAKLGTGKLVLEQTPFNLSDTVTAVDNLLCSAIQGRDNQLSVTIAPDIPKTLIGDVVRIKQVLINLVGNANKFTNGGKIAVMVHALTHQAEQVEILFEVTDNGIGIAKEKQQSIFDAFSQADASTTRDYGGTGLGLAICQQLIEQMGGRIWLESELKLGSSFYFTLTLTIDSSALSNEQVNTAKTTIETAAQDDSNPPSLLAERLPLLILVAEDNLINQMVISQILLNLGYQADVVNNGVEVLAALKDKAYDLVLMDIQMPEMDGIVATQQIKIDAQPSHKPWIVAMTANTSPEDVQACLSAGMLAHIAKPIVVSKLEKTLIELAQH